MKLNIVVAMGLNRVIGAGNQMPWHLPADLKHFKATTMGFPMIMGRLTYESIGKPLPGRPTVVVTRDRDWVAHPSVSVVHSLDDAIAEAKRKAKALGVDQIMVVGGANIYEQTISQVDRLYVTEVHTSCDGDAFFPAISSEIWVESARRDFKPETPESLAYSFVEYVKTPMGEI